MKISVNPEKAFIMFVLSLGMGVILELGVLPVFGITAIWIWVLALRTKNKFYNRFVRYTKRRYRIFWRVSN
jgi:hypothetical protein